MKKIKYIKPGNVINMRRISAFFQISLHKFWVSWYILKACAALIKRAVKHDLSKYSKEEEPHFSRITHLLKDCEYGSDLYKKFLQELEPALKHHYSFNSHHPEHYIEGMSAMSDLDRIELLCDWRAAARRHKTGNLIDSINKNSKRFNYDIQRLLAFIRDSKEMGL
jgi:Family of unknown function (DUF5662)